MKDCAHCFHSRNEDCSQLTCIGFKPVGSIDIEILKGAAKSVDNSRHPRNKQSSRLFAESEERVKAAERERAVRNRQEPPAVRPVVTPASAEATLRAWRREQASKEHLPAYCIFPDSTLQALVSAEIKTKSSLLAVRGIGPKLYAKYADALFEILRRQE